MTVETYLKYVRFLAEEASKAMENPTDDVVVRLTSEFNTFKDQCMNSALPEMIRSEISRIHLNYTPEETARSTWVIIIGVLSIGFIAALLYYRRRSERREYLQELKTHLEALAMRSSMRDQ